MVGDSYADDIEGARALGMRAILVDRDGVHMGEPDRIDTLLALPAALGLADGHSLREADDRVSRRSQGTCGALLRERGQPRTSAVSLAALIARRRVRLIEELPSADVWRFGRHLPLS